MLEYSAVIEIIGVNPFVRVPAPILADLFRQAGRDKGPIPIAGKLNDQAYTQTLVKFQGEWRLYVNTTMLKDSPERIGETISLSLAFDSRSRAIAMPAAFLAALQANPPAQMMFDGLSPSLRQEIVRYLSRLKSSEALERNVERAINFLLGKERFVGRPPLSYEAKERRKSKGD